MVLNFTEIPIANSGDGFQDTFELFSRDFLDFLGFEIIRQPDRGPDGKKDMIVSETRNGIMGNTSIKWLVSCKHYANSKKSVSDTDEPDILDRVSAHSCDGFLGVYSTICAVSLNDKTQGYKNKIETEFFDRERIEAALLKTPRGINLARRYFPKSIEQYIIQKPKPAKIFETAPQIKCDNCGKDLLTEGNGIFAMIVDHGKKKRNRFGNEYYEEIDLYFACKGDCDMKLEHRYEMNGLRPSGWDDIDDLKIPTLFLKSIVSYLNQLSEESVSDLAHKKIRHLYTSTFPYVSRHLTTSEEQIVSELLALEQY